MALYITNSVPMVGFYTTRLKHRRDGQGFPKAHIQDEDLHVTVCIPSLWREPNVGPAHNAYNREVAKALHTIAADHEAAMKGGSCGWLRNPKNQLVDDLWAFI